MKNQKVDLLKINIHFKSSEDFQKCVLFIAIYMTESDTEVTCKCI